MFAALDPGTWTELIGSIVGFLVAAVLGGIAIAQAKKARAEAEKANFWAEKATEAQERANELAEAAVSVAFFAELQHLQTEYSEPTATMTIGLRPESDTIFVHGAESAGAYFTLDTRAADSGSRLPIQLYVRGIEVEYPVQLQGGERLGCEDPWRSYRHDRSEAAWAKVLVHYSVTRTSRIKDAEILVDLLPPKAVAT